jgi:hypothetical protein
MVHNSIAITRMGNAEQTEAIRFTELKAESQKQMQADVCEAISVHWCPFVVPKNHSKQSV